MQVGGCCRSWRDHRHPVGSGVSGWGRGHGVCITLGWQGQPAIAGRSVASPVPASPQVSHIFLLIIWLMKPPQPEVGCAAPSPAPGFATVAVPMLEPQTPAVGSPGECGSGPMSPASASPGGNPPKHSFSPAHSSPQCFPVPFRVGSVGHSPLSQLAHPGWQGLGLKDAVWAPHLPWRGQSPPVPGQYNPVSAQALGCFPVW